MALHGMLKFIRNTNFSLTDVLYNQPNVQNWISKGWLISQFLRRFLAQINLLNLPYPDVNWYAEGSKIYPISVKVLQQEDLDGEPKQI